MVAQGANRRLLSFSGVGTASLPVRTDVSRVGRASPRTGLRDSYAPARYHTVSNCRGRYDVPPFPLDSTHTAWLSRTASCRLADYCWRSPVPSGRLRLHAVANNPPEPKVRSLVLSHRRQPYLDLPRVSYRSPVSRRVQRSLSLWLSKVAKSSTRPSTQTASSVLLPRTRSDCYPLGEQVLG
jgi:hypothetical protein